MNPTAAAITDAAAAGLWAKLPTFAIGDCLHRVDGAFRGESFAEGFELAWREWVCVKVTPQGGWFSDKTWPRNKQRFALASGCKWGASTKEQALRQLLSRKRRHLAILESQREEALETQALASALLKEMEAVKPPTKKQQPAEVR